MNWQHCIGIGMRLLAGLPSDLAPVAVSLDEEILAAPSNGELQASGLETGPHPPVPHKQGISLLTSTTSETSRSKGLPTRPNAATGMSKQLVADRCWARGSILASRRMPTLVATVVHLRPLDFLR